MIDPASPSTAAALLREFGLHAGKRLGQSFLCDRNTLERIVDASGVGSGDNVLEIGAGLGGLTQSLSLRCGTVVAVEVDRRLEPILQRTLAGRDNVRLLFEDFLAMDLPGAIGETGMWNVVANVPYYITTPILERLIETKRRLSRIALLVQQEFAERMAASPGTKAYSALTVFAQYHTAVELVGRVPRSVFLPRPEVDSAIVTLTPRHPGTVAVIDPAQFETVSRAAFAQRRKTLQNSLVGAGIGLTRETSRAVLDAAGIDGSRRGETLSLQEFAAISDAWSALRAAVT